MRTNKMLDANESFMTDRAERYKKFDEFYEDSKDLFEAYSKASESSVRLDGLYSFYVSPGGRHGGLNKKIVDVFYGKRPFDSTTTMGTNFQKIEKLETAHGATLSYQRTDDGQVLCTLSPAASENFHHPEDFILLSKIKNPTELKRKSKWHWEMFQAYMESTCLDGRPSVFQKLAVFYLRNFKEYVANKTLHKRRATVFFREIAKYTATVGLSGFIILIVTWSKDSVESSQAAERHLELLNAYSHIDDNVRAIASYSEAIEKSIVGLDKRTNDNLESLTSAIFESALKIESSIDNLREKNEAEAMKDKGDDAQTEGK
ncbi:hypothetical protein L1D59_12190 [Pseudoalteromonas piscicida]|uniref:hypothetical protein n=2 Tax=Pseudoalteromonas TaxID=53246 RepID=UPI001EFC74F0|nr:hypothetical protein [Pseudoalteromonas piscicida]MCG9769357.1 hypothetical protein [Pseudoalteromonas piscicida]